MPNNDFLVPISEVKGVGKQIAGILRNNNIYNTYALINNLPKSFADYLIIDIDLAKHNEVITIVGTLNGSISVTPLRRVLKIMFLLNVKEYQIMVTLFRPQDFLSDNLNTGDLVLVKGKFNLYKSELAAIDVKKYQPNQQAIIPKYKIEGISDYQLRPIIKTVFQEKKVNIIENLPLFFINKYQLLNRLAAYQKIHLPSSISDIDQALKRFKYEEALYLQLGIQSKKKNIARKAIYYDLDKVKKFIATIPFTLTEDQKAGVNDIFKDFKNSYYSYRLIQGDVGSGKTIVAAIGLYGMITARKQVALMVPTEILAQQHYAVLQKLFNGIINIALLTQSTKDKEAIRENLKNGNIDLVIGTQSLIQTAISFKDLGLVIIDEQHRFGVNAREELENKNDYVDTIYLTATPIPRTLAISYFGDMDITSIYQKPQDRQPVKTFYYSEKKLKVVFQVMKDELAKNHKVFIVVPAIDSQVRGENIETVYQKIKAEFSEGIYLLHGKLKNKEIKETMAAFQNASSGIMIATTMIEVGIDIKEATVMVIFAAEHFGLSQLHQLRGRIGRSEYPSFCFLISKNDDVERLSFLANNYDGFKLSEYDLLERGPGEFIGLRQSGNMQYKYLNFNTDFVILKETKLDAKEILSDPSFASNPKYFQLRKYLNNLNQE